MSCARPLCYLKGHSKYRPKKCRLPNAWNEFQYVHSKEGWSKQRLKDEYQFSNRGNPLKCDRTQKRLMSHENNIDQILEDNDGNICEYTRNHAEPEILDSESIRKHIAYEMARTGKSRNRLSDNFGSDLLLPSHIERLMNIIDKQVFDTSLLRNVRDKLHGPARNDNIEFLTYNVIDDVFPDNARVDLESTIRIDGTVRADTMEIQVNRHNYGGDWQQNWNNGILPVSQLDDLIITLMHQCVHLLLNVECYEQIRDDQHGPMFKKLNMILNGFGENEEKEREEKSYSGSEEQPEVLHSDLQEVSAELEEEPEPDERSEEAELEPENLEEELPDSNDESFALENIFANILAEIPSEELELSDSE
jgi:hypothetical protein